ncbi:hypothetical protein LOD99_3137 [Oopsacas minuta]|uniref:Uncharacterized protein n=1 Tax=Oopsacas minuta TaxID=111878 RepID=A0AAV7JYH5_9METZ|nr:hypothetical protein LOD99_3137 [Oopsacas minuta]
MLEHHNAIDTFVGDNVYQRLHECSHNKSSIQLPKTSGGNPFHLTVSSSSTDERPAKLPKMDFSHIANLKCSGMSLFNKQLKVVTRIIRDVGVPCPSMDSYYRG